MNKPTYYVDFEKETEQMCVLSGECLISPVGIKTTLKDDEGDFLKFKASLYAKKK